MICFCCCLLQTLDLFDRATGATNKVSNPLHVVITTTMSHESSASSTAVVAVGLFFAAAVVLAANDKIFRKQGGKDTVVVRGKSAKPWRMSKWVKHNKVLKCQGLVGAFDKIPGSSTAQQTAEALEKLESILKEAGSTKQDLLSVSIFIADYDKNFNEMNEVYDAWVDSEHAPVRICVQAYMGPGVEIEIQAEAKCD